MKQFHRLENNTNVNANNITIQENIAGKIYNNIKKKKKKGGGKDYNIAHCTDINILGKKKKT